MKKHYLGLWAILAVSLVGFGIMSLFSSELEAIGLKTPTFASQLLAPAPEQAQASPGTPQAQAARKEQPKPVVTTDTTSQRILFIGDSMLEGLGTRLADYATHNGHTLDEVIWYSSNTQVWAQSGNVAAFVKQYNPTFVVLCIGANELFVRNIEQQRTPYVQKILKELGNLPFVWIGPPNWKPDTGINHMLQTLLPQGTFYLSYTPDQHYDRNRDGAHPTRKSAAAWMDRVVAWWNTQAAHRIVLETPPAGFKGKKRIKVLQPPT